MSNSQILHDEFDYYLQELRNGLVKYQCKSKSSYGLMYYKNNIEESIQGLQRVYSKINEKKIQKEVGRIASALSKSYQLGGLDFLEHYITWQNKIVRLKDLVANSIKRDLVCHFLYSV